MKTLERKIIQSPPPSSPIRKKYMLKHHLRSVSVGRVTIRRGTQHPSVVVRWGYYSLRGRGPGVLWWGEGCIPSKGAPLDEGTDPCVLRQLVLSWLPSKNSRGSSGPGTTTRRACRRRLTKSRYLFSHLYSPRLFYTIKCRSGETLKEKSYKGQNISKFEEWANIRKILPWPNNLE